MNPLPYMLFHSQKGYSWKRGTEPAPDDLLQSVAINVSQPDALMTWLETNNASLISDLNVHVDATDAAPSPQRWCLLFDKLQREATNIQNLEVFWDAEGTHMGLGKSVVFVRGLAQLKVEKSLEIAGHYAMHWPGYLEEEMGLKPVAKDIFPGSDWVKMLRNYQRGTESRDPRVITEDGTWDVPRRMDFTDPFPSLLS